MNEFASYDGSRVTRGTVTIPMYGLWSADVDVATADAVAFQSTLVIGNLSLVGYSYRDAAFAGLRRVRLGAGYGGWRKMVGARAYHLPIGIPLSLVLLDVAADCGERLNAGDLVGEPIGGYYLRDADPASHVLRRLAGPIWWVDTDGTTRLRARDTSLITSPFTIIDHRGGEGRLVIATEDLASWMPGRTVAGNALEQPLRIQSVTHTMANEGVLRTECLVVPASYEETSEPGIPTLDDRIMASLRQIVANELPRGVYNDGSTVVLDGGTGTSNHVTSIESVVAVLASLLPLLPFSVPMIPSAADAAIASALAAGGVANISALAPLSAAAITAAIFAKCAAGDVPYQPGICCPEVRCG